jgi:hypothetical protein
MSQFTFTLRFDDEAHTMTRFNGLPASRAAELILALAKALNLENESDLVLSEVKGNCYALELTAKREADYEHMKVVHKQIEQGKLEELSVNEFEYVRILKKTLQNGVYLKVYDPEKSFEVTVAEIVEKPVARYFYQETELFGFITAIGGKALDGQAGIRLNDYAKNIEISAEQEADLKSCYKSVPLALRVQEKVSLSTLKVEQAKLLDFEKMQTGQNLLQAIETFRNAHPGAFDELAITV